MKVYLTVKIDAKPSAAKAHRAPQEVATAPHAIWTGTVSFGSIAFPVRLRPAVRERRVQFNLLHKSDLVRLKRQMVCSLEGAPVPPEDQARGFELEGGRYILVDPAELEKAEPEASRAIAVHEFVGVAEIDPVYFERGYYLEPAEDAGKTGDSPPARLLRTQRGSVSVFPELAAVLEEERLAGICTWVMRKRAYVGAILSAGGVLRLNVIRHPGEVIKVARPAAGSALSDRELAVGSELINQMTGKFQPEKFTNSHQQRLRQLIERKSHGQKIRLVTPKRRAATEPDKLLSVLEASLRKVA